jgi:allantoinase
MNDDLVLRSRRVVTPEGERPATVRVRSGTITAVEPFGDGDDLGELVLLPGLVDTHVHLNEPGRTEWEGFATATAAAAAGGVTTLIDMPLNSVPPTVTVEALEVKRQAAAGQCWVDVGFWGGAVPGNTADLAALHSAGVFGFKSFLIDSGVPEFPPVDLSTLADAFAAVPALFVIHAEQPGSVLAAPTSRRYADFEASRPPAAEEQAVAAVLGLARRHRARVHILHVSAAEVLPLLTDARRQGVRVSAETCPHYLTLTDADVPDGATQFKCCPPIRGAANRDALWHGLSTGALDCVVSDHSPCPPELKRGDTGDFAAAWGGISSVQLGLALVWTEASRRGLPLTDVSRWLAQRPAELVGLRAKGRIAVGADADLVAFDPDVEFVVDPARLRHRHPVSPYAGRRLRGAVRTVWLRGEPVDGEPRGRLLSREAGRAEAGRAEACRGES